MKRISHPLLVAAIVLSGLLLSSVVAQPGAYTISAWIAAGGGGGSTGGAYGLDGTIGQSVAGRVSGGAYTLDSGYWAFDDTLRGFIPPGLVYLPVARRSLPPTALPPTAIPPTAIPPTPVVTLACNDPKDNEGEDLAKAFTFLGQPCIGSFTNPPGERDDWYFVNLSAGQTIRVEMTVLPAGDNYDVFLYVRGNDDYIAEAPNRAARTEIFIHKALQNSRYYVRVYDRPPATGSAKTYVLKVTVE